ncbi:MAG: hypothetical protein HC848_10035 [Limnobacter sp.]|nr:hypothetical protein [Limnobacter sp.]
MVAGLLCLAVLALGALLWEVSRIETLKTSTVDRLTQEQQLSTMIIQANHYTTKMASAFKNTLIRGIVEKDRAKYSGEFKEHIEDFHALIKSISALPVIAGNSNRQAQVAAWSDAFDDTAAKYAASLAGFDPVSLVGYIAADKAVRGIDRPVKELGSNIEKESQERLDVYTREFQSGISGYLNELFLLACAGVALLVAVGATGQLWFAVSIKRKLGAEPNELAHLWPRLPRVTWAGLPRLPKAVLWGRPSKCGWVWWLLVGVAARAGFFSKRGYFGHLHPFGQIEQCCWRADSGQCFDGFGCGRNVGVDSTGV